LGQSRKLLDKGFFAAIGKCLWVFDRSEFRTVEEQVVGGSKVDYVGLVDGEPKALCETKSPSAVKKVSISLPPGAENSHKGEYTISCRLQHWFRGYV